MNGPRSDQPSNLRSLEQRISNIAQRGARPVRRIQRAIANTVIGQMLPPGVVKGGTAMKLRVGEANSRFTPDLDAARSAALSEDAYLGEFDDRLAAGWGGFTGTIQAMTPPLPEGVPDDYIMKPFEIRLSYRGRHWLTATFELGRDEVGSTVGYDLRIADDLVALFREIGLERPEPIAVLAVDHQIAQKLHACTSVNPRTGKNERAHDLVDIQILMQEEEVDLAVLRTTALRLFSSRNAQTWPPSVIHYDGWTTIYAAAADGLAVISRSDEAVAWANELISRIDAHGPE